MQNITIFDDYKSFKDENKKLIDFLVKNNSLLLNIMRPVLIVVDYLYEYRLKNKISKDEEYIFNTGYDYLYDQFQIINTILEQILDNNYNDIKKYEKTINLLLYINDFKQEVLNDDRISNNIDSFLNLESNVYDSLNKKEEYNENYYILLNDLVYKTFDANGIELNTINDIFYNIALEYDLIKEDENIDIFRKY